MVVFAEGLSPITVSATKLNQLNVCPQLAIYRNITTPSLSYAHCAWALPQSKKICKKVATLEKTTVLYRSTSLLVYEKIIVEREKGIKMNLLCMLNFLLLSLPRDWLVIFVLWSRLVYIYRGILLQHIHTLYITSKLPIRGAAIRIVPTGKQHEPLMPHY